jgi:hypothetical protein
MIPIYQNVRALAVAAALALGGVHAVLGGVHGVAAQNFGGGAAVTEQYFRIDAEPGLTRKGHPVLRGYVYNRSTFHVDRVRLRVDAAGADTPPTPPAGQPTAPLAMGWVNGEIEANGRRYFEVAVPRADASYRVSVDSFEVRFNDLNG